MLHILTAKHVSKFNIWIEFDDGTSGVVDLEHSLDGPIFQPLKDESFFSKVAIDPELETIAWPNGADLAPEFVKALQVKQALL